MKTRLAIFASGSGTNTENLIQYFKDSDSVTIELILSNKSDAYVLERAKNHNMRTSVFSKRQFIDSQDVLTLLEDHQIDFIILAGFLLLIPQSLIKKYPNKIINIHPSLLPKYGGKGMYGSKVHHAVIDNKETESGITIHLVNELFDDGKILFQQNCKIDSSDSADSLAAKIHTLEHAHFPSIIENYIRNY
jgi:phosphoribosylglycinamide formyltransferase-1